MCGSVDEIGSVDDLRSFVHQTLCQKENLLGEQFRLTEMRLKRKDRCCGLQFTIHGPRSVRLGAIWAADHNVVYFYDTRGGRYLKVHLRKRFAAEAN